MNHKENKNKWDKNCIHLSLPLNIWQLRDWNVIFRPHNDFSFDPSSSDKESFIMCQHVLISSSTVWELPVLLVLWACFVFWLLSLPHSLAMSCISMLHATHCYLISLFFWGFHIFLMLFFPCKWHIMVGKFLL